MREKYLEELALSMAIGTFITAVILSLTKNIFTPSEFIVAFLGTSATATYCVWSVIDWIERRDHVASGTDRR